MSLVSEDVVSPTTPTFFTQGLLRTYWTVPDRQIETSVVLASPPIGATVVATET